MNLQEYHAHPAWSSSRKKSAATKTMRSYWAEYEDPTRKPKLPTQSMQQGSLVDAYITDFDRFRDRYFVLPEDAPSKPTKTQLNAKNPSATTIAAIEAWREINESAAGKEIITKADLSITRQIHDVLLSDPDIAPILDSDWAASQDPFFWTAEAGYDARYLPDIETENGELWDLKLTRSANPRLFRAQSYSLGYDIQLDHYRQGYIAKNGVPPTRIGIIAYEWEWPHNCCLLIADEELLEHGHERGEEAVAKVLQCREAGFWPSYGVADLKLPAYADFANPDNDNNANDLGLEGI